MAREGVRQRMFGLVKRVRAERLRGLKKPADRQEEEPEDKGPPKDELEALEAMLGKE